MNDILAASRAFRISHGFWRVMDWLYPPRCAGCRKDNVRWCLDCQAKVKVIHQSHICLLCGIPQPGANLCQECITYQPVYTAVRSWGWYEGPLRSAIHQLKYHNDMGVSEELAKPLAHLLTGLNWQVDLITAVPLSKKRRHERGYNQSALLARWLGLTTEIPFRESVIVRSRDTSSQVGLHAHERRQNVMGAFTARSQFAAGKSILIIDDVTTTGATMQACAQALQAAGASQIYGLTLARAGQIHLN